MPQLFPVTTRLCSWLQRHSPFWPAALGMLGGVGMGAAALWGIGGVIGAGVCLIVVSTVYWVTKDAEPVWLDEETWSISALCMSRYPITRQLYRDIMKGCIRGRERMMTGNGRQIP
jgi:hypothetical protein